MSLKIQARYGSRANDPSIDYPTGSVKNKTAPDAIDGTPLEKDWANDLLGARDAILQAAGIVANGDVDTAVASQVLEALDKMYKPRFMTFAQITALTEDQGPIIVYDMDCTAWAWVVTAYFTGYRSARCGHWDDGWTPNPLPFQINAIGNNWNTSNEKEKRVIARYRESNLVVPSASWIAGQNMIADLGGGVFKAPDLRNMFKRMSGTDADTANARALGAHQQDALQNITGSVGTPRSANVSGAFLIGENVHVYNATTGGSNLANATFDASRVARASTETRASSAATAPFIHV